MICQRCQPSKFQETVTELLTSPVFRPVPYASDVNSDVNSHVSFDVSSGRPKRTHNPVGNCQAVSRPLPRPPALRLHPPRRTRAMRKSQALHGGRLATIWSRWLLRKISLLTILRMLMPGSAKTQCSGPNASVSSLLMDGDFKESRNGGTSRHSGLQNRVSGDHRGARSPA